MKVITAEICFLRDKIHNIICLVRIKMYPQQHYLVHFHVICGNETKINMLFVQLF